jgi:SNF2 family DNA or RNA helicase
MTPMPNEYFGVAASVILSGEDYLITPLIGTLPELKSLGATWDARHRCWKLAASLMNRKALSELLPDVYVPEFEFIDWTRLVFADQPRLFDYQIDAASRLAEAPHGQLVVLSPGLGKTAVAIVAADASVPDDQIVVVAPASLLRTWEREIRTWGRNVADAGSVSIMHGKPDFDAVREARWLLVSWDTFVRHTDWFLGTWPLWILDESVLAKSRRSHRFKKLDKMRKSVKRVWLLSGSPTTRHSDDLWAQLHLIWPRAFTSYWRFAERYCVVEETPWARVVSGTRRDRDAVKDNADLMIVVNQEDVLDLPEYLFEAIDVDLTPRQAKAYKEMLEQFITELDSGLYLTAESRIAQLLRLQQITSWWEGQSAKHDAVVDLISGGAYEPPFLFWTHWRDGGDALAARLADLGTRVTHVNGGMSPADKDSQIEAYRRGTSDALVLSIGVGKFGMTLTNTKTVFYMDKTFNADDYFQSLRRVRRIGLTHRPVIVTLRAPGTVDELVERNLEGKVESIARVTSADLRELLRGLGR